MSDDGKATLAYRYINQRGNVVEVRVGGVIKLDNERAKPLRVYFGHGKRGKSVSPPVESNPDYEAELDAIRDSFNARGHWYFGKLIFDALRGIKK